MAFWIVLLRSLMAVALGLSLLFIPDKTRPLLGNFMGAYWLTTGLVTVRFGTRGERPRKGVLFAGIIGMLVGILMISRRLALNYIAEEIVFSVLGGIVLLTGILHLSGGLKTREANPEKRFFTGMILGVFEIILGLIMIFNPLETGPILNLVITIWALVGGFILLGDALQIRRQKNVAIPTESEEIEEQND